MKESNQYIWGGILLFFILLVGVVFLDYDIMLRLLVGTTLGYALSRGSVGFTSSITRMYSHGSTKLFRSLLLMFGLTSIMMAVVIYGVGNENLDLWINPINSGLIFGGLIFGFGVVFSKCCVTGALFGAPNNITRTLIVIFSIGLGVLAGFPFQMSYQMNFVNITWIATDGYNGVYLPYLFGNNDTGIFYSLLLTLVLIACISVVALKYETFRKNKGTYRVVDVEENQDKLVKENLDGSDIFSMKNYEIFFVKPWSREATIVVVTACFVIMTLAFGSGWSASTPYGLWVGKILMLFGVSSESLANHTNLGGVFFTQSIFADGISVQNIGIVLGALCNLLLAGKFSPEFKLSGREIFYSVTGGFLVGFATRLANGCNVGAMYTPIANFSLSGWIFLVTMIVGAIIGCKLHEVLESK